MTLTGDGEALEEGEVLGCGNRGAVGSGEGLDGILHGCFASRLKHPSDPDGSVVIAHEGDGRRSGEIAGGRAEQVYDDNLDIDPCFASESITFVERIS